MEIMKILQRAIDTAIDSDLARKVRCIVLSKKDLHTLASALGRREFYERHVELWQAFNDNAGAEHTLYDFSKRITEYQQGLRIAQESIASVLSRGYSIAAEEPRPFREPPTLIARQIPDHIRKIVSRYSKDALLFLDIDKAYATQLGRYSYEVMTPTQRKVMVMPYFINIAEVPDTEHPYNDIFVLHI